MDRSQNNSSTLDDLRQIQYEARNTNKLEHLRYYFERVQELRRTNEDDFELQIEIARVHDEIIDYARRLRDLEQPQIIPEPIATIPVSIGAEEAGTGVAAGESGGNTEVPPNVQKLDAKTWQLATYLALFFAVLLFAAFFYLIQSARRLNLTPNEVAREQTAASNSNNKPQSPLQETTAKPETPPVPVVPTLRLYTDLIPGTVTIDEKEPEDLKDGELILDKLEPGRHSLKVVGRNGNSAFSFDIAEKTAPRVVGAPIASNAMAVLVSTQDGKGLLITNEEHPTVLVDGKPAEPADAGGVTLDDLGTADHDLQVSEDKDRQRFVLTYTPAPALTVYVKSDPNAGTVVIMAGQDGADVFINDKPYRRKTDRGQVRVPLKVGEYAIRIHKAGFIDPAAQTVTVKKSEESAVEFKLEPSPEIATLQIKGALPGTMVYLDKELAAAIGNDGNASISTVKPGDHVVELRREQALPKHYERTFRTGEVVVLSGPDVTLDKVVVESKPVAPPAPVPAPVVPEPNTVQVEGEQVRRGGGFVPYHTPKAAGRYSFQAQARKSGIFKRPKLQWYAGYRDSSNFVLFVLDGKRAIIRETRNGQTSDLSKTSFELEVNQWVQVDLSVKANTIRARVKTQESGWKELDAVTSPGRDFTQDKVGFYIPGSDEVAVSDFKFSNH